MDGETGPPAGLATGLTWRAVGADEPGSGPRWLELATLDPGIGPVGAPGLSVPGPGLDALIVSSAAVTAADLGLDDLTPGLDTSAREATRRLHAHVDLAWASELGIATESPLLDRVLADGEFRLPRGEEAALGAALARALERGNHSDGVEVSLFRDAAGPLEDLLADLPTWDDGLAPRLVFDREVLQLCRVAWRLLHVTHQAWFAACNRTVGGAPRRLLQHPVDAWARQLATHASAVVARVHVQRSHEDSEDELGALVNEHFTWATAADGDGFRDWLQGRILTPVETVLAVADPGATDLAVHLEPYLPVLETEDDVADAIDAVGTYLGAWLMTDAGLLARLHRELHLASDNWAWRRVVVPGGITEWSVADVGVAAQTAATALDVEELLRPHADPV